MKIALSPCPNDTFSFYALIHNIIDHDIDITVEYHDVETLNKKALLNEFDLSKVSFAICPQIIKKYCILNAGAALGKGCGPLLVSKNNYEISDIPNLKIVVPGQYTTANLLLKTFYPKHSDLIFSSYENILPMIEKGAADCGVIIHENRFTYANDGFCLLDDLGKRWENNKNSLLPLGGIIMNRGFGYEKINDVSRLITESIEWAFANREDSQLNEFIKRHAQEMDYKVIHQHIDLYVNEYSLNLGLNGQSAVGALLDIDPMKSSDPLFAYTFEK